MSKPAFDPSQPYQVAEGNSKPAFDPSKPFEDADSYSPSELESGLLGAEQGLTFGLSDELRGAAASPIGALKSLPLVDYLSSPEDESVKAYAQARDEARQRYKQAEEVNPYSYGAGNLVGTAIPAALTFGAGAAPEGASILARLAQAGKVGAARGALNALGTSEADLTKDQNAQLALDTLGGAVGGVVLGGVVQGGIEGAKGLGSLLRILGQEAKDTKTGQILSKAYQKGTEGKRVVGTKAKNEIDQELIETAKKLGLTAEEIRSGAGKELGAAKKAFEDSGKTVDLTNFYKDILDKVKALRKSNLPEAQADADKLENFLKNIFEGKETEKEIQLGKVFKPSKVIPGKPSAREVLENEATLARENAKALGQNLNTNITESQDESGKKLLTLLKSLDENVAASERPILDKETGEVLGLSQNTPENYLSNAKAKTIFDYPATPEQVIPQSPELLTQKMKVREGNSPIKSLSELQQIKEDLAQLSRAGDSSLLKTDKALNLATGAAKDVNSTINNLSDIGPLNEKYSSVMKALSDLGLDGEDFRKGLSGQKELTPQASSKLTDLVRQSETGTSTGIKASDKMRSVLDLLNKAAPEKTQEIGKQVQNAAENLDLAQKASKTGFLNKLGSLETQAVHIGNRAGLAVKKLSDATPESIKNLSDKLLSVGGSAAKLGNVLSEAIKKDDVGRNALLFSLQQNPGYREILKKYVPDLE